MATQDTDLINRKVAIREKDLLTARLPGIASSERQPSNDRGLTVSEKRYRGVTTDVTQATEGK